MTRKEETKSTDAQVEHFVSTELMLSGALPPEQSAKLAHEIGRIIEEVLGVNREYSPTT